jgi:hypothetical protein
MKPMKLKIYIWRESKFLCDYGDGLLIVIAGTEKQAKRIYFNKQSHLGSEHDEEMYFGENSDSWWGKCEVQDIKTGFCESLHGSA